MSSYGPLAGIYDDLTYDVDYPQFADFYEDRFGKYAKKIHSVLDLGCGTGSITMLLAQRGYETIAVDRSEDMLMIAQEKATSLPSGCERPLFLCQEMALLDLYGTVDAAVSTLDAINYLPPEEVPELFRRLHLFIDPEGVFIFDINSPERLRSLDGSTSVDEDDKKLCLWRADLSADQKSIVYAMDIFVRRGELWRRETEEHTEYLHEPEMLSAQLQIAGFKNIEIIRDGPQHEIGRLFIAAENTPHEV